MTQTRTRTPVWNEDRAVFEAGETATHLIDICPMIYNHRVVLTPKSNLEVYDLGWCYPTQEAAFEAVAMWDPETDPEPAGYLKRVF